MILCEIPLCYAAAKAYFVRRDPHGALVWLGRTVGAGVSALGGVTAALALWFAQEWLCFGSAADAWQNMTRAVTDRVSLTDGAVRDVNVPQVLAQYFRESTEPLLQLGPVSIAAWQLLLFALLVGAVSVVARLRRGTAAQLVPPCIVWGWGWRPRRPGWCCPRRTLRSIPTLYRCCGTLRLCRSAVCCCRCWQNS